jgi:patatin-like phospholipase/acyl hydrolase
MLSEIESRYLDGRCVGDYFDMITGTSTGGIIALGLSIGKTANTILELYMKHGDKVFPPARYNFFNIRKAWRWIQGAQHHRHDPAKLEGPLKHIFGSSMIGDAERRLCIPSFDGFTEVNVFKTPHHRDYKMDWKEDMITVAMATAAAPTYFPVYKNGQRMFADGGVWANNPIMIGLVDALVCYQLQRRQVHILSLGTGDAEIQFNAGQILHGGLWDWAEIISSAMHLQSQNATGQAGLLIGRDQLIRLNAPAPSAGKKPIDLDDYARASAELPDIARKLIDNNGDVIRDRFLCEPADPYQPFHGPRLSQ